MRSRFAKFLALFFMTFGLFETAVGQEILTSDYAVVYPNKLQRESVLGSEISRRLEVEKQKLAEQYDASAKALEAEEAELTAKRDQMPSEEFNVLAVAFDKKSEFYRDKASTELQNSSLVVNTWLLRFSEIWRREVEIWSAQNNIKLVLLGDNLIWADPGLDISPIIVQILNAKYSQNKEEIDNFIFAPVEDLEDVADQYSPNGLVNTVKAPAEIEGEKNE